MNAFEGLRIISHPLLDSMRVAKLKLSPTVPVSDKFRSEFDAWLLDQFGDSAVAIIIPDQNQVYMSPNQFEILRNFP